MSTNQNSSHSCPISYVGQMGTLTTLQYDISDAISFEECIASSRPKYMLYSIPI